MASLPGRDAPLEGAATGRNLALCWFEKREVAADGIVVGPCDEDVEGKLRLTTMTLAEISRTVGYFPAVPPDCTARQHEICHEERFLQHCIQRYTSSRFLTQAMDRDTGRWSDFCG